MSYETRHTHTKNCLDWLDQRCCPDTSSNVILYFMGDFGRAHLWTGAMKLAYLTPRLRALNTTVVLVGEGGDGNDARLDAAARLAEELRLPFTLIADTQRILWRQYAAASANLPGNRAGLVLVDGCGRPVRCWSLQAPQQKLDLDALLATLESLSIE